MNLSSIYKDIALRTGGNIYIGVVGPVRSGKSCFIKKFLEELVIPKIEDPYLRARIRDELPQSGSGKTIMTAEPKFIPEEAVNIDLSDGMLCSVRLADCVGYMINGAAGNTENGDERLVMTPWYEREIPISKAAEEGTRRVINDHSTIGIIVTTDGSICGIPRSDYIPAEEECVGELKKAGKPFVMILTCADPDSEEAKKLANALKDKYECECFPANCLELDEKAITEIISSVLNCFPIEKYRIYVPEWIESLDDEDRLKSEIYSEILNACSGAFIMGDRGKICDKLSENEHISSSELSLSDSGSGIIDIRIAVPRNLYYDALSSNSGLELKGDKDLMKILTGLKSMKDKYERIYLALEEMEDTGYSIIMPSAEELRLEEPQVVKQGGRYGVKLKASAPSIHIIKTDIETEVSPAIGGERASEEMINFLIQGFDGDMSRIWDSNIFGKSLNDIAGESLAGKIKAMPSETKSKLRGTVQRIVNEGSNGLICIIL